LSNDLYYQQYQFRLDKKKKEDEYKKLKSNPMSIKYKSYKNKSMYSMGVLLNQQPITNQKYIDIFKDYKKVLHSQLHSFIDN